MNDQFENENLIDLSFGTSQRDTSKKHRYSDESLISEITEKVDEKTNEKEMVNQYIQKLNSMNHGHAENLAAPINQNQNDVQ